MHWEYCNTLVLRPRLRLNYKIFSIGIVIEFLKLRYWYWYLYWFSKSGVLILKLVSILEIWNIDIDIGIETWFFRIKYRYWLIQASIAHLWALLSLIDFYWNDMQCNNFWNYFSWVMSLHWRRIKTVKILPWHAKRMEECLQIHKFHCLRYGKICGTTFLQLMLLCSRSGCNLQKNWSPRFYYDTASD